MNKIFLVQDGKVVFEVNAGQRAVFTPKIGKKYQLSQDPSGKSPIDNIVAAKKGSHLVLLMPDHTEITINNFYLDCSQNLCSIEANQKVITTLSGVAGPATGDNTLVYAEGDTAIIQSIAKGNDALLDSINQYLANYTQTEPSTSEKAIQQIKHSPVGESVNTFKTVSSVVGGVGPGLLIAAGGVLIAGAASGGGGSGSSSTNNTVSINSKTFSVNENATSVGTLSASQTATWSFDTSGSDASLYADNSLFNLNTSTGVLTFKTAPDYESTTHSSELS